MPVVHLDMTCALCGWAKQCAVEIEPDGEFRVPDEARQHALEHQSLSSQVIQAHATWVFNAASE